MPKYITFTKITEMKKHLILFLFFVGISSYAQQSKSTTQIVEASCGQCQFGMKDKKGCDLAVRIDGKSYFVEGTKIDDHGDAHSEMGFCNAVRKAEVTGEVKGGKFVATSFKLLPAGKK